LDELGRPASKAGAGTGAWSPSSALLGLGDDAEERGGEPGCPVPDGDVRGPITPVPEVGRRLAQKSADSCSPSVIATSSPSIEAYPDDHETREALVDASWFPWRASPLVEEEP